MDGEERFRWELREPVKWICSQPNEEGGWWGWLVLMDIIPFTTRFGRVGLGMGKDTTRFG